MLDIKNVGKRIAVLRRERGYTGEALAEQLHVSPQAVSKWENAKCLPETAILPELADALGCSIDSLLYPRELFILEAIYTDGETHISVTHFINALVRDNTLNIYVDTPFVGASIESGRMKMLTVKYQTPEGIYFSYALQNENLFLDKKCTGYTDDKDYRLVGAYYGNENEYLSVMQKMRHYEYFKWDKIEVNHENFPSNTASDDTEYLALIYLNSDGIHAVSCPENDAIYYEKNHTQLITRDKTKCILQGIMKLSWGKGMECPWAGAHYAALRYMGEAYGYNQIMGISGACWRVCFTDVWDYSCTDALVSYDYATPLYRGIGYSFRISERLEKQERKAERQAIMEDIQNGRPVLAINLRVAPEWGVITGYTDDGNRFLCRTYFDEDVFHALESEEADSEDSRLVFEENEGYLFSDFWPFIIVHFGEKNDVPPPIEVLNTSLTTLIDSFNAKECRGYYQGKEAYREWIKGLSKESDFSMSDKENAMRRMDVNDSMICSLIDSRCAAAAWLRSVNQNISEKAEECKQKEYLEKMAANCQNISDMFTEFRDKLHNSSSCEISYNTINAHGASSPALRAEQISLLENALILDDENCRLAKLILNG